MLLVTVLRQLVVEKVRLHARAEVVV
jgi:hypothetical protein